MTTGRLLLVDDDPDIRTVAGTSLQSVGGWEVVTAASGREAVEVAEVESFDVIVLDIMMPGMDGPTTLLELRKGPAAGTPVVFLTAKVQQREVNRILSLGAVGFIPKPFDPMTLPGELDELLAR